MEGYLLAFQPSKYIFWEMKREILSAPNLKKTCESPPPFGHNACCGHSSRPAGSPDNPLSVWRQCLFGCLILLFALPWKIYSLFPWSFPPFSLSCLVCLDLSSLGQRVSIREIHFLNHLKGASWWVPRKKRLFLKSLGWGSCKWIDLFASPNRCLYIRWSRTGSCLLWFQPGEGKGRESWCATDRLSRN